MLPGGTDGVFDGQPYRKSKHERRFSHRFTLPDGVGIWYILKKLYIKHFRYILDPGYLVGVGRVIKYPSCLVIFDVFGSTPSNTLDEASER